MKYIPDELWDADPSNRLCINRDWAPYVLGLLYPGGFETYWRSILPVSATDTDVETAAQSIVAMQRVLSDTPVDCDPDPLAPYTEFVSFNHNLESALAPWAILTGQWVSGLGVEVVQQGIVWSGSARFIFPYAVAIEEITLRWRWSGELYVESSPPNGNVVQFTSDNGFADGFTHRIELSNDNLNGYSTMLTSSGRRQISDRVTIYIEVGVDAPSPLAWLRSVFIAGYKVP